MVISSREASWFISIAIILVLLLNKSLIDIRPKFRALVVPPGLGAVNICQGVKSILNNIVLTFRGQNPNSAVGEIRFAMCCTLKWNTLFHTVCRELRVPLTDSWLRRDFGVPAQ